MQKFTKASVKLSKCVLYISMAVILFIVAQVYASSVESEHDKSWEDYYLKGMQAMKDNKNNEAIKEFEEALKLVDFPILPEKQIADIYHFLARCFLSVNELTQARIYYQAAVALNQQNSIIHYELAGAFEKEKKYANALVEYNEALALDPDNVEIQNKLASLTAKNIKADKLYAHQLERYYESVMNSFEDDPVIHYLLAKILSKKEKHRLAQNEYIKSFKILNGQGMIMEKNTAVKLEDKIMLSPTYPVKGKLTVSAKVGIASVNSSDVSSVFAGEPTAGGIDFGGDYTAFNAGITFMKKSKNSSFPSYSFLMAQYVKSGTFAAPPSNPGTVSSIKIQTIDAAYNINKKLNSSLYLGMGIGTCFARASYNFSSSATQQSRTITKYVDPPIFFPNISLSFGHKSRFFGEANLKYYLGTLSYPAITLGGGILF